MQKSWLPWQVASGLCRQNWRPQEIGNLYVVVSRSTSSTYTSSAYKIPRQISRGKEIDTTYQPMAYEHEVRSTEYSVRRTGPLIMVVRPLIRVRPGEGGWRAGSDDAMGTPIHAFHR